MTCSNLTDTSKYPENTNVEFTNTFDNQIDFSTVKYLSLAELMFTAEPPEIVYPISAADIVVVASSAAGPINVLTSVRTTSPPDTTTDSIVAIGPGSISASAIFDLNAGWDASAVATTALRLAIGDTTYANEAALTGIPPLAEPIFSEILGSRMPLNNVPRGLLLTLNATIPSPEYYKVVTGSAVRPFPAGGLEWHFLDSPDVTDTDHWTVLGQATTFDDSATIIDMSSGIPAVTTIPTSTSPAPLFQIGVVGVSGDVHFFAQSKVVIPDAPSLLRPRGSASGSPPQEIVVEDVANTVVHIASHSTIAWNPAGFSWATTIIPLVLPPKLPPPPALGALRRRTLRPTGGPYGANRARRLAAPTPTYDNLLQVLCSELDVDRLAGASSTQVLAVVPFDYTLLTGMYRITIPVNSLAWKSLADMHLTNLTFTLLNGTGDPHPALLGQPIVVTLQLRFL